MALIVVGAISLSASTCLASIAGPHWPTGDLRTMSRVNHPLATKAGPS